MSDWYTFLFGPQGPNPKQPVSILWAPSVGRSTRTPPCPILSHACFHALHTHGPALLSCRAHKETSHALISLCMLYVPLLAIEPCHLSATSLLATEPSRLLPADSQRTALHDPHLLVLTLRLSEGCPLAHRVIHPRCATHTHTPAPVAAVNQLFTLPRTTR